MEPKRNAKIYNILGAQIFPDMDKDVRLFSWFSNTV